MSRDITSSKSECAQTARECSRVVFVELYIVCLFNIRKCVIKHNSKFVLQDSARFSGKGAVLTRLSSEKSVFPFF